MMPVWGMSCAVQVPITVVNGTIYGTDGQATTLKGVNWCAEGPPSLIVSTCIALTNST